MPLQIKDENKILLLEGISPSAVETLKAAGYHHIEYYTGALDEDSLKDAIKDARFVGIRSGTQLSDAVLAVASKLVGIGCFCIGTNQVDLVAAKKRGIPVFNAPFSNTRSVAELVLGEMILLLRRIPECSNKAHLGIWHKNAKGCYETRGKNLGIIGYGHIGSQLSVLAEAMGMHVHFYDTEMKLPLGNAKQLTSLETLLVISDVVSLHVPDSIATRGMINETTLKQMKKGVVVINASRGKVVDVNALAAAIQSGHVSGAAVDVFPEEPPTNRDPFLSPLRSLGNVILTPHIGGSTEEAQKNIGVEVARKLCSYSDTGSTLSSINFPEVVLPIPLKGTSRFLNIHKNEPGTLTAINGLFAEHGFNISGQYLQTDTEIGYVVIDCDYLSQKKAHEMLIALKNIPGTLRARLLF